jgi:hypothetical protein
MGITYDVFDESGTPHPCFFRDADKARDFAARTGGTVVPTTKGRPVYAVPPVGRIPPLDEE